MEDLTRLASKVPLDKKVEAFFGATCLLQGFVDREITPLIGAAIQPSPLESALATTHFRINGWLRTLTKLNSVSDIQAVCSGARSIFELAIDMGELAADHSLAERFHAFTKVERFYDAKLAVEFVDANQLDPSAFRAERVFVTSSANVAECDRLIDKFFSRNKHGDPIWPSSWSPHGRTRMRCQRLGPEYSKLYRFTYKRLSWYVHAGAVGTGGIDEDGLKGIYGWAHFQAQDAARLALDVVAKEFHLFASRPELRKALKDTKKAVGLAVLKTLADQGLT